MSSGGGSKESVLEMAADGGVAASSSSSSVRSKAVLSRSALSFRGAAERHRPVTERRPVYMAFSMDVLSIDVRSQSFRIAAFINFFWRVTPEEMASVDMTNRDWQMEDDGVNMPINANVKVFDNQLSLTYLSAPHWTYLAEKGVVQWRLNCEAELTEQLELGKFPFDRQLLTAHLNVRSAQWRLLTVAPTYVPDLYGMRKPVTYRLQPSVSDWTPFSPVADYRGVFPKRPKISVRVERQSLYFVVCVHASPAALVARARR